MASYLNTSFTTVLKTPLPTTDVQAALSLVRDHKGMVTLNPLVVDFTLHSQQPTPFPPPDEGEIPAIPAGSEGEIWKTYDIVDEIPRFGGLWTQRVEYQAGFLDVEKGLKTEVRAPAGVELSSEWIVEKGEDGKCVLAETTTVHCVIFLVLAIKWTMTSSHEETHRKLVEKFEKEHGGK